MLVLFFFAALATGWYFLAENTAEESEQPVFREVKKPSDVRVYLAGAVEQPGVVLVSDDACVQDVVNKCGGVLPTADVEAVNMAQSVKDGMQVTIPEKAPADSTVQQGEAVQDGKVNLNLAAEKELDTLPGIGPAMAKRILEYRQANGRFQDINELRNVKGIGEAKFAKIKDKVTL